jgi:transposase
LVGSEPEKPGRNQFIFECRRCGHREKRDVSTL